MLSYVPLPSGNGGTVLVRSELLFNTAAQNYIKPGLLLGWIKQDILRTEKKYFKLQIRAVRTKTETKKSPTKRCYPGISDFFFFSLPSADAHC